MKKPPLIRALTNSSVYDHPVAEVELIETHISWVLLAGDYAYKIKKPVRLPFVDFSSLDARRAFCEDELRLNRRLAPHVYLDVVAITGNAAAPTIGGEGPAIEYAVRMRRFEQRALFNRLLERGALQAEFMDTLAARIAAFHADAPTVPDDSDFGMPATILQAALDNFSEMLPHAGRERQVALNELQAWTKKTFHRLEPVFAARHRAGYVRECHGDLHLRNIALIDAAPVAFDCIEFSAGLRWIDVMSEVAFLLMDLLDRDRAELGYRFLDGYLQASGDYGGIVLLRFYLVYRALVRAKIHDLRARQALDDTDEARQLQEAAAHYLALAKRIVADRQPALILMHGFSGTGKSHIAAALLQSIGAIRLRSDVERKRLFGLAADARSDSAPAAGIYDRDATGRTYKRLAELAKTLLTAGYPSILDAAFLKHWQRVLMRDLAVKLDAPWIIVDCAADTDTLRERVSARDAQGRDASEATLAVLERQMASHDPLTAQETQVVVRCDMGAHEATDIDTCLTKLISRFKKAQ